MTEEDTFNRLKKLPYEEMCKVYEREYKQRQWNHSKTGLEEASMVCKKHGWTYSELIDAFVDTGD